MAFADTLLTILILGTMALLTYLRMTKKTLVDFVREMREVMREGKIE